MPKSKPLGKWMSLSMAIVVAIGVVASIPKSVLGQAQPQLSAEQQASLEEAKRLIQQVIELYKKGKYEIRSDRLCQLRKSCTKREKGEGRGCRWQPLPSPPFYRLSFLKLYTLFSGSPLTDYIIVGGLLFNDANLSQKWNQFGYSILLNSPMLTHVKQYKGVL